MEGAVFGFTPGVAKLADGAPTVPQCFSPAFALQKDLLHQASQGAVPVVSWPFSEFGYLEGSFRDEASKFQLLDDTLGRLKVFSAQFCWHFGFELLRALSSSGRVDCHRLRRSRCDRLPPSLLKACCVAPLLSCQRLGTSQTRERMGATLRLATRRHPPNAPGQTCTQDKAQIGTPWTQVKKSRPTSSVPIRCLPWYGSTSHLGTVAKRTRLLCYGCQAGYGPPSCVRYCPVTDGVRQC